VKIPIFFGRRDSHRLHRQGDAYKPDGLWRWSTKPNLFRPAAKTDLEKRVAEIRRLRLVIDGVEYEDVSFANPTVTDVTLKHSRGSKQIPLAKLPVEWQKKLGYDPEKEKQYWAALAAERHAPRRRPGRRKTASRKRRMTTGNC